MGKKRSTVLKGELMEDLLAGSGATVCLAPSAWPKWAKDARDPNVDQIFLWPHKGAQTGETYRFTKADGRLTVIRYDSKDVTEGFPYNKDVYIIVCASNNTILQYGPYSKGEADHWLENIPEEYEGWPVVTK